MPPPKADVPVVRSNPVAKALRFKHLQLRKIGSGKSYRRRPKHRNKGE
jgi:hypothetical protein